MVLIFHSPTFLITLLAAVSAAVNGKESAEQRLGLDLTRFDEHLARVDTCLKALPSNSEAKVADCIGFEDAALDRCDKAFGAQLETCMTEAEKKPASIPVSGMMPELKQIRDDLVSCYERMGIRPRMVGTMNEPLSRCGFTQLHKLIPDQYILSAETHIRDFVNDKETFGAHYKDVHKPDVGSSTDVHDMPLNLPGGRFEAVPPATGDIVDIMEYLTLKFNTPKRLEPIWKDSIAQLSYVLVRAQHNDTAVVTDQEWHHNRDTTEDIRLSVSVHKGGPDSGPLEFMPTSHRLHPRLQAPIASFPRGRAIGETDVGDMVFYFARTKQRETKRTGHVARVSLDMVLHSTGRYYHPSSDRDPEKVEERYLQGEGPAKATATFKKLWAEILRKNTLPDDSEPIFHYRGEEL
mmetsp:Transcript_75000/g.219710  ORF Transcript_75000/g.219710 Transcript_75000/m.219710 type:complete len:407 (-) Transcript_75000:66-1286(-)